MLSAGTREKVKFCSPSDLLVEIDAALLPESLGGERPASDRYLTDRQGAEWPG